MKKNEKIILGNRLAVLIKTKNITQKELSDMTNITTVTISNHVKGKCGIRESTAEIYSQFLDCDARYLYDVNQKYPRAVFDEMEKGHDRIFDCVSSLLKEFGYTIEETTIKQPYSYVKDDKKYGISNNEHLEDYLYRIVNPKKETFYLSHSDYVAILKTFLSSLENFSVAEWFILEGWR